MTGCSVLAEVEKAGGFMMIKLQTLGTCNLAGGQAEQTNKTNKCPWNVRGGSLVIG